MRLTVLTGLGADISSARLAGIEEDLGLSPVQYQTAVSILFAGYILAQ